MSEREILDVVSTSFGIIFAGLTGMILKTWIVAKIERWRDERNQPSPAS
jgi:hypothetical protein